MRFPFPVLTLVLYPSSSAPEHRRSMYFQGISRILSQGGLDDFETASENVLNELLLVFVGLRGGSGLRVWDLTCIIWQGIWS